MKKYKGMPCPVCGNPSFGYCTVCGWDHNEYQEAHPDEGGLQNVPSLNQFKEIWDKEHRNVDEYYAELMQKRREQGE